jgi:hypothetical protein
VTKGFEEEAETVFHGVIQTVLLFLHYPVSKVETRKIRLKQKEDERGATI